MAHKRQCDAVADDATAIRSLEKRARKAVPVVPWIVHLHSHSIFDAPQDARDIAVQLKEYLPGVGNPGFFVAGIRDSWRCIAEVCVIINASRDVKGACDLVFNMSGRVVARNWFAHLQCGFNQDPAAAEPGSISMDTDRILAMTRVMSDRLTQGFIYYHTEWWQSPPRCHMIQPILYGGVANDGSIVGVLLKSHCVHSVKLLPGDDAPPAA